MYMCIYICIYTAFHHALGVSFDARPKAQSSNHGIPSKLPHRLALGLALSSDIKIKIKIQIQIRITKIKITRTSACIFYSGGS